MSRSVPNGTPAPATAAGGRSGHLDRERGQLEQPAGPGRAAWLAERRNHRLGQLRCHGLCERAAGRRQAGDAEADRRYDGPPYDPLLEPRGQEPAVAGAGWCERWPSCPQRPPLPQRRRLLLPPRRRLLLLRRPPSRQLQPRPRRQPRQRQPRPRPRRRLRTAYQRRQLPRRPRRRPRPRLSRRPRRRRPLVAPRYLDLGCRAGAAANVGRGLAGSQGRR